MSNTIKDDIFDVLRDLNDDQFKLFKSKLCDRSVEPRIRKSEVEKADRLDLVEIIISRHTTNRAVSVTVTILKSMHCNELATELEEEGASRGGGPTPAAGACGTTAEKHFIDRHRTALIERVCNVTAILDRLLECGVVTQSGHDEIQAGNTKQDKMRKLLSGPIHSGGEIAKDALLEILETQEPFLMDDLKGH
ncbi:apoptosis-associated speck-like protein containing a CARD [Conger conger]|uniref:apoptosis-associated speck-like protein containing a CARD n=1 Tax=Conger conger TaxID=82655 RepID=UPI002A599495|nr:apoptosis-associated speck-like protein containing a CARD [Conger conger]